MNGAEHGCKGLVVAGAALLLSACGATPVNESAEIIGEATYRERVALPDGGELLVTLEDVSRVDAKAEVIGATRFTLASGPPFGFALSYDPRRIDPSHRYAVRARIEHDGRLLFTTDTHYPVLTQGGVGDSQSGPQTGVFTRCVRSCAQPAEAVPQSPDTHLTLPSDTSGGPEWVLWRSTPMSGWTRLSIPRSFWLSA